MVFVQLIQAYFDVHILTHCIFAIHFSIFKTSILLTATPSYFPHSNCSLCYLLNLTLTGKTRFPTRYDRRILHLCTLSRMRTKKKQRKNEPQTCWAYSMQSSLHDFRCCSNASRCATCRVFSHFLTLEWRLRNCLRLAKRRYFRPIWCRYYSRGRCFIWGDDPSVLCFRMLAGSMPTCIIRWHQKFW